MKNNKCEDCNGNGYINTYNTKDNIQEIQRCDTCKVYNDDDEALEQLHFKIRNILIDYNCDEYGDCIIDDICEVVNIENTNKYYYE